MLIDYDLKYYNVAETGEAEVSFLFKHSKTVLLMSQRNCTVLYVRVNSLLIVFTDTGVLHLVTRPEDLRQRFV